MFPAWVNSARNQTTSFFLYFFLSFSDGGDEEEEEEEEGEEEGEGRSSTVINCKVAEVKSQAGAESVWRRRRRRTSPEVLSIAGAAIIQRLAVVTPRFLAVFRNSTLVSTSFPHTHTHTHTPTQL